MSLDSPGRSPRCQVTIPTNW